MSLPAYCRDCGVYLTGGMIERAASDRSLCVECADDYVSAGGCDDVHCGNACSYVEPYGFVPEADCPVHDR